MRSALLALLISAPPAAAAPAVDHERFALLGWNKSCSAAVSHLGFPRLGEGITSDPVTARIGALTIQPGEQLATAAWRLSWDGRGAWKRATATRAQDELKRSGYAPAGRLELVRPDAVVPERDLPRLILTTDTFRAPAIDLPEDIARRWRLAVVHYSPLDTCALLVFKDSRAAKDFFQYALIRIGNPAARSDRALAHVTNGLLLLERGDRSGALAETAIAAAMAPDDAGARYHHGAMLALSGEPHAALDALEAAVTLDPSYKKKARQDANYEELAWMPRFKELTKR